MKNVASTLKTMLFLITMLGICISVKAQKIDEVQNGSVRAKSSVRIDGKLTEWGDTLKAYNKSTKLWYTLANDDKNIYLVIKSTNQGNNNKILAGGISLAINTADKKKDKDAFIITYPVIAGTSGRGAGRGRRGFGQQQDAPDSAAIADQQKTTLATAKEISAIGFKDITDTIISIYNEYSIKAAANFDNKGNFIYELSVPLSLLGITADGKTEIAYNIKVNGQQAMGNFIKLHGSNLSISGNGGGGGFNNNGAAAFGGKHDSASGDISVPDDFWGRYILAGPTP
jgi:hypothetical protein